MPNFGPSPSFYFTLLSHFRRLFKKKRKKKRTTTVQFNSHPQPVITHIRRLSDSNRIVRELGDFLTRLFSCNRFRFVIILNIFTRQIQSYPQKNVVKVVNSASVLVIESLKLQLNFFFGRTKTDAKGTSDVTKA